MCNQSGKGDLLTQITREFDSCLASGMAGSGHWCNILSSTGIYPLLLKLYPSFHYSALRVWINRIKFFNY